MIDPLRPVARSEPSVAPVELRRLTPLEREEERRRREEERRRREQERKRRGGQKAPERTPDGRLDIRA